MSDKEIIDWLRDNYPGLVDGETEINGSDLVADLTTLLSSQEN